MKIFYSLLLLIVLTLPFQKSSAKTQNRLDSLEKVLKTVHDTDKFDVYYELVKYYQNVDLDKMLYYVKKSKEWAKYTKNLKQQATATKDIGMVYYFKNEYDSALKYYQLAIKLYKEMNGYLELGVMYHEIGNLYWTQAIYSKAVENYLNELHLCEENADSSGIAKALGSIAFIYGLSGEHDKALEMQLKVLSIWTKLDQIQGKGVACNNIANSYKEKKQNEKALEYYFKSLSYKDEKDRKFHVDVTLLNIGIVYLDMKKYDSAGFYYYKALAISDRNSDFYTGGYIHHGLASLYRELGKPDSVKFHLDKALVCAEKAHSEDALKQIYKAFSEYYASAGMYKESYNSLKKYTELADSLLPGEAMQKVAVYELEKVQANLKILEKEKEIASLKSKKTRNQRNFSIVFSILILLLAIAIFNRFLIKRKSNIALEKANLTKDKFFTIISHDLKNQLTSFQTISQVLAENFQQIAEEKKHHLIIRINNAAKTLNEVLENLLTWSSAQLKGIDFEPKQIIMFELINHTLNELNLAAEKKEIQLINEVPDNLLVWADENMAMNIIRNLVNNSIKFSPEKTSVRITVILKDQMAEVSVVDQGTGISKTDQEKLFRIDVNHKEIGSNKEKGSGLGLIISKEFVEKMGGKIWVESSEGKGSSFTFSLPIKK